MGKVTHRDFVTQQELDEFLGGQSVLFVSGTLAKRLAESMKARAAEDGASAPTASRGSKDAPRRKPRSNFRPTR